MNELEVLLLEQLNLQLNLKYVSKFMRKTGKTDLVVNLYLFHNHKLDTTKQDIKLILKGTSHD